MHVLSVLTPVAGGVVSKVALLATDQLRLEIVFCFRKELNKLKESSILIGNIIHDAAHEPEDGDLRARAEWMKRLITVAYDAEDILDKFQYEVYRIVIKETSLDKKILGFFCNNPLVFRLKMARKIYKINTSLEDLYKQAAVVGLVRSNGGAAASQGRRDRETTSFPEKNVFTGNDAITVGRDAITVGRDQAVSNIIATLTNSNNQENILSVMAIVGLGGLGKTTLARLITKQLKEGKMGKHFDTTLWVCVSNTFDVNSILHRMVQSCGVTGIDSSNEQALMESLQQKLEQKRYFLVLDDVWNEDANRWNHLGSCLLQLNSAKGSSVIVNTRSAKVASIMGTLPRWNLETLSEDDCWSILKDRAFVDHNAPIASEQEKMGREIAKKCAGLPLAAKVLRSLFSNGPVSNTIFQQLMSLRVLSFSSFETEKLLNLLGKAKHLRYLDLSCTDIEALPKSIGKLYNLQTLRLPLHLQECPKEIQNLINLRYFYFGEGMKFEAGFLGRLTNLRRWPSFNVGEERGPAIKELGGLNQLRGHLIINGLEGVRDGEQAKKACLLHKSHLSGLTFRWTANENKTDVLDGLEPHGNLQSLNIEYFMGARFPSWITSLQNLKQIRLDSCNNFEGVPTLGHLPNLRSLEIQWMKKLKRVGAEVYGYSDTSTTLFPALKTLSIFDCPELIEWMEAPRISAEGEVVKVFPCLEQFLYCRSLQSIAITQGIVSLRQLNIRYCVALPSLEVGLDYCTSLQELEISGCPNLVSIPTAQGMPSLRKLKIESCDKLSSLGSGLNYCTSLQELEIKHCYNLTSIPITQGITSLWSLTISYCKRLLSLPSGLQFCTSLQHLEITHCPSLVSMSVSYVKCDHPESANQPEEVFTGVDEYSSILEEDCSSPESSPDSPNRPREVYTGLVEYLSIQEEDCPSVESIPNNLRHLLICHCGKFKLVPTGGFHRLTGLKKLRMGPFWEELDAFPDFQLPPPHDSQLEYLVLEGWPKLKSLPQQIEHLTCLKELLIKDFTTLEALPEWMGNLTCHAPNFENTYSKFET